MVISKSDNSKPSLYLTCNEVNYRNFQMFCYTTVALTALTFAEQ